jgi:hypothetical protein
MIFQKSISGKIKSGISFKKKKKNQSQKQNAFVICVPKENRKE